MHKGHAENGGERMAKEALEKVRQAEEKAREITREASQKARDIRRDAEARADEQGRWWKQDNARCCRRQTYIAS